MKVRNFLGSFLHQVDRLSLSLGSGPTYKWQQTMLFYCTCFHHNFTWLSIKKQNKTKQNKTKQKTKQNKTKQNKKQTNKQENKNEKKKKTWLLRCLTSFHFIIKNITCFIRQLWYFTRHLCKFMTLKKYCSLT